MAKREDIEKRTEELVQPIIDAGNYELVDVEYVKEGANKYLRVYADKEGGININDCVDISRALEAKLDEDDFIEEAYILEVSSPGLGRPLKKDKDFSRAIGENVDIKLYKANDYGKELEGQLMHFDDKEIVIKIIEKEVTILRKDIAMIRLAFDF